MVHIGLSFIEDLAWARHGSLGRETFFQDKDPFSLDENWSA